MIQLTDVTKIYPGNTVALAGVSLRIRKGELVVLTGASGAGKTTLLRTIFAGDRPDKGQIVIAGRDITRLRSSSIPYLRRNIGVVFQDFKLLSRYSAVQNVAMALYIRGRPAREAQEQSRAVLGCLGLESLADVAVGTLSGGEQQRVAIARALVGKPSILLADEPTGNLDPDWSRDILRSINAIAKRGTTVLIATHDPAVIEHTEYSRVVRLRGGKISQIAGRIALKGDNVLYPPLASTDETISTDANETVDRNNLPANSTGAA